MTKLKRYKIVRRLYSKVDMSIVDEQNLFTCLCDKSHMDMPGKVVRTLAQSENDKLQEGLLSQDDDSLKTTIFGFGIGQISGKIIPLIEYEAVEA